MLHITASTKLLKEELRIAHEVIRDIMGSLNDAHTHPSKNLTKHIGQYITDMPEFKVLTKDAESAKQLLRKVCSGEIMPIEAFHRFDSALREIIVLRNLLDSTTSF